MQVKIFSKGSVTNLPKLEAEINEWLATLPKGAKVVDTNTAVAVREGVLRAVVTVWVEGA